MNKIASTIFISIIFLSFTFPVEAYTLDKIIIKSERKPIRADLLEKNYSVQTISPSDIKQDNPNSLADLLDYVAGLDLRYRGTSGIQGDLSLRGSTYEQIAVLIDGLRIIDPQTGHHNLDIPLTNFDVEEIEVTKEGISSLYGAGAFAGSINIVTKKPTKKSINIDTIVGEHALFGETFSFSLPQSRDGLSARISLDHKISKAARPNTDFEYETISLYLDKALNKTAINVLLGYQKKDFGADSFYSNLFPEEEEHTETFFVKTGMDSKLDFGFIKNSLFLRKHRDKFILKRNAPTSVNYHTTYVYGINSQLSLPIDGGNFLYGIDIGRDEIYSTNLGKHARLYEAAFGGFTGDLSDKLSADLRLRFDHYPKWNWQESYNLGLGYKCFTEKLRIKTSLAHAFRIPSFTDLYYSDSANKGNPVLGIEESDSFRAGLDFKGETIDFSVDGFLRQGHNLIDWTRIATTDPWAATNLGKVNFKGVEFSSRLKPNLNFAGLNLGQIKFSYNYTEADKKASGFLSKYALDILKHQYMLDIYSTVLGFNFNWQSSYNQRYYGEIYFIGNLYVAKKIINKNFILEPFIKIDNFNNAKYTEVSGVMQPGRWIKFGLKLEW